MDRAGLENLDRSIVDFLPDDGEIGRGSGDQMTKRTRRNHTPAFKAKVALPRLRARGRWPSWRSSSMSTPIKSRNGRVSFSKARPVFSDMAESRPCQRRLI